MNLKDKFQAWRDDWPLFAKEALGVFLDPEQEEILRAIQFHKRVSVSSGTARGKDFVAAVAAICFLYLMPSWDANGVFQSTKVFLTAPTARQIENIMVPQFSSIWQSAVARGMDLPGRLVGNDIQTGMTDWFLTGFKADAHMHEAWTGLHAVNIMFVVTEATGIPENIYEAIEGNLQGNSRILLVFNPNVSVGYAARSQRSPRWKKFQLNSLNAPNVLARKTIIPGQVDYDWLKDKLELWCRKITPEEVREEEDDFEFEGQWYRPEDAFRKKVLGKFPKVGEDTLIPPQWIELANKRWLDYMADPPAEKPDRLCIGTDIAGQGRDFTVHCYRYGPLVDKFDATNSGGKADHMKHAGVIYRHLSNIRHKAKGAYAVVDTAGEGAGVYSRLMELGLQGRVFSCKFAHKAKRGNNKPRTDITGQRTFANMRAYLFWCVRDWLDPRNDTGAMLPPDDMFMQEATEIKWIDRSNGDIIIEPKEDIKERIGRSTDYFDALANTFYPAIVTEYNSTEKKEDYGFY